MGDKQAIVFLGRKLFNLYKEKYPEVTNETTLEIVPLEYVQYGTRILLPSNQPIDFESRSMLEPLPFVEVNPSSFECWAKDKYSPAYHLAFIKELDCIYAHRI